MNVKTKDKNTEKVVRGKSEEVTEIKKVFDMLDDETIASKARLTMDEIAELRKM